MSVEHPHTVEELHDSLVHHDQWFRHDATEPHHQPAHGETQAWGIIGVMVATLVFVVVVAFPVFFMWEDWTRGQIVKSKEGQTRRTEYVSLRSSWDKQLTSYEWADPAKGTVRVPIDVAWKQVMARYSGAQGTNQGNTPAR